MVVWISVWGFLIGVRRRLGIGCDGALAWEDGSDSSEIPLGSGVVSGNGVAGRGGL